MAGRAECARVVREFVSGVLGSGHRCRENAILLVNREAFGNSVRHSRSGERGGTATVAATVGGGVIRVEVADRSGAGIPQLCSASGGAEGGRRLRLSGGPGRAVGVAVRRPDGDLVRALRLS